MLPSTPGETSPDVPTPADAPKNLTKDAYGPVRYERMSKVRRTIAAQMSLSAATIPQVTTFADADVTELEHIRKSISSDLLAPGVKLTAMSFVMKAVATALRRHPALNASIDESKESIVFKEYIHLGVAVGHSARP